MWVLVSGQASANQPEGAIAILRQLGCDVEFVDFWQEPPQTHRSAPTLLLIEAGNQVDVALLALERFRKNPLIREIPSLIAVTVHALQRLQPNCPFDDFVLMPFVPAELYSRIRRLDWRFGDFAHQNAIKIGDLLVDLAAHEVHIKGNRVELTQKEFELLAFLCSHRGKVFTRQQLLSRVWAVRYGQSRTVDIHVRRLRMKLGHAVNALETVRGVGYKWGKPEKTTHDTKA